MPSKKTQDETVKNKSTLQEQVNSILEKAEQRGVSTNFFFTTTFKRYQVQMATLSKLEEAIRQEGPTVTKEYVRGRGNIYINPAVAAYNQTTIAANGTVATLIKIIEGFADEKYTAAMNDSLAQFKL